MNLRNECTLLELIQTVSASAGNEDEVVGFASVARLPAPRLLSVLRSCPSSPGPGPHQNSPGVPQKLGNLSDYPASHSSPDTSLHASNSVPNRVSPLCSRISLKALAIHACLNCISRSMW